MGIGAIVGGALGLVGASKQASAAKKASSAQERAAAQQVALQREIYEDQKERFQPFYDAGLNALNPYLYEIGLAERPDDWAGLSMSPGARFALEQGRDTIEAGAAARSGLRSGATLAGLERLRMGMAAQDRDNQLNRLAGVVDSGQGAAANQATAGNAFAGMASQAIGARGNAQAAGHIGAANAWGNALGGLTGAIGYQMANNPNSWLNTRVF